MELPLSQGAVALIDPEDYPLVGHHKWTLLETGNLSYAYRRGDGRTILLHRVLMDEPPCKVDHINGDGLDNRRCNLRTATSSQNSMNRGPNRVNLHGFKGVAFHKPTGRYNARIKVNGKLISLRYHDTPEDAARAYDEACRRIHGEFCRPNFHE